MKEDKKGIYLEADTVSPPNHPMPPAMITKCPRTSNREHRIDPTAIPLLESPRSSRGKKTGEGREERGRLLREQRNRRLIEKSGVPLLAITATPNLTTVTMVR